jgi:hypothetical protein
MIDDATLLDPAKLLAGIIRHYQRAHATGKDPLGSDWCRRKFIGQIRRELIRRLDAEFAAALKHRCRLCGGCELAREPA